MILLWHRVRSLIPHSIKRRARKFVWMRLNPSWTLPSGIVVRVLSYSDWIIYNDIFVDGEYDRAIDQLIGEDVDPTRTVRILDLGANVGLFTLRLADAILRRNAANFDIIDIEGSPSNYEELRDRLGANKKRLQDRVHAINGLIGERGGFGEISEGESCGENTLFSKAGPRVRVPFVDVDDAVRSWPSIDLLKCDIEGAEELFLANYPDLLKKVQSAVFEFHHDKCDVARCRQLLAGAGLQAGPIIRQFGSCSVEFFSRES
jgi:FkbM family methyltransferase